MTKKARMILFFICAVLFFITAPSVVLYSQGYRLDFDQKKLIKTGAFYAKVLPKGAEVFIANELKKKTDFFFGSIFIENLLPKKYAIEIKKQGYQSWKKDLEIQQAQVAEAKNIILVPNNLNLELLEKDINQFFISPNSNKMIWQKKIIVDEQETWGLKLFEPERNITSHIIYEHDISPARNAFGIADADREKKVQILDIIWSFDEVKIILKTQAENKIHYFLLDLSKNPALPKALSFLEQAKNISWHANDSEKIFFQNNSTLFQVNTQENIPMPFLENIIAYKTSKNSIFWLGLDGYLYQNNFNGNSKKISLLPIEIKQNTVYEIYAIGSNVFLKENEVLLSFDNNLKTFKEIGKKIKFLKISPDSKKICLVNDFEAWVLFLEKQEQNKVFLTRFSKNIEQVFWWTNHYLIFGNDSKIKILEIDDRDAIQIWDLEIPNASKIYFNQKNKRLYVLSNNNLFVSDFNY